MAVNKDAGLHVYKMESKPRGIAVIINNETFARKRGSRRGTNEDAEKLQDLFSWLNFDTKEPYKDLKDNEMRQTLEEVAYMDHSNYDCLMVAILSHGKKGDLVMGKEGIISIKQIIEVFSDEKCPTLAGKPKIFIIQACRGTKANIGVLQENANNKDDADASNDDVIDEDDEDNDIDEGDDMTDVGPAVHPNISDYIVAYSTIPGHVAFRGRTGSIFITNLEEKFRGYARKEDMITILERVIHDVTQYQPRVDEYKNSRQSPEVRLSLKGKIYLNPSADYN